MAVQRRPMVVVESARPDAREAIVRSLRAAGLDVTTCPGPAQLHGDGCPLVETADCSLTARADAVVHDLDLDDPDSREVLASLRARYERLPVVVEATTAAVRRHRELLEGCTVIPPYSSEYLAEVVQGVIASTVPA